MAYNFLSSGRNQESSIIPIITRQECLYLPEIQLREENTLLHEIFERCYDDLFSSQFYVKSSHDLYKRIFKRYTFPTAKMNKFVSKTIN